jgi:ferrous iron transport protein A
MLLGSIRIELVVFSGIMVSRHISVMAGSAMGWMQVQERAAFRPEPGMLTVLSELGIGSTGIVEELDLPEDVQHLLMHMGFVPDARVMALRRAPAGDPTVYAIDGMEIALRRETARSIHVRDLSLEEQNAPEGRDLQ